MRHPSLIALGIVIAITAASSLSATDSADSEIRYLLQAVGASGCAFVRNGQRHEAPEAASHLRMKYERGKQWVGSAEQFIERIASKSSLSGDPYYIECVGESPRSSNEWLLQRLAQHRLGSG